MAAPLRNAPCCRCKKAGHEIYSQMLGRDVIFNHHNPMISADYDFLHSCTRSFQQLLKGWASQPLERISKLDFVLFLLFNLERRVELRDAAVLDLFGELVQQSHLRFKLLVVKVVTRAEVEEPQQQLLMRQARMALGRLGVEHELRVHELRCRGNHDGWRFSDEVDLQALEAIVHRCCAEFKLFAGAPTADLAKCVSSRCPYLCTWLGGHCCHRCLSTSGASHGPRCDRCVAQPKHSKPMQSGRDHREPSASREGYACRHEGSTVSRAERFRRCFSQAQEQQLKRPGSLLLQTSALRRLQRCLNGSHDAQMPGTLDDCLAGLGYPIQEGPNWRLWCPAEAGLKVSLKLLWAALHGFQEFFFLVEGSRPSG